MFSQQYRPFWSRNVFNLVSRKDKGINRSYLGHILAEKMRLGHVRVRIKHIFLKAVVTCILLENLSSKK